MAIFRQSSYGLYKILTMDNRARLHAMLDDLDDDEIIAAEAYLCSIVDRRHQPETRETELAHLTERRTEFEKIAEGHWREAVQRTRQDRGIVSSFGGGGSFGFDFRGRPSGKVSFSYGEGTNCVEETLRFVAGQEVEIVNRVGLSPDGANLVYKQAVKSGGRTATWEESFPFTAA